MSKDKNKEDADDSVISRQVIGEDPFFRDWNKRKASNKVNFNKCIKEIDNIEDPQERLALYREASQIIHDLRDENEVNKDWADSRLKRLDVSIESTKSTIRKSHTDLKHMRSQLMRTPSFINDLRDWQLEDLILYSTRILNEKNKELQELENEPEFDDVDVLNETVAGLEVHKERAILHLLKAKKEGREFNQTEKGLQNFLSIRCPDTHSGASIVIDSLQEAADGWKMKEFLDEYRTEGDKEAAQENRDFSNAESRIKRVREIARENSCKIETALKIFHKEIDRVIYSSTDSFHSAEYNLRQRQSK